MKIFTLCLPALAGFLLIFSACSETAEADLRPATAIAPEILEKIAALGFSTEEVRLVEEGYVVEGDILLSPDDLLSPFEAFRVPQAEQYQTFNLVAKPRTITIRPDKSLDSLVVQAVDSAIARYNAQELELTFQRVGEPGADIAITSYRLGDFLAYAGFPRYGAPYAFIRVNRSAFHNDAHLASMTTVIAHEIGHCIGFRHTDWFDRSISCGGDNNPEKSGAIGALHIPGTPVEVDSASWMLSCIPFFRGVDRPFTAADSVALKYLY